MRNADRAQNTGHHVRRLLRRQPFFCCDLHRVQHDAVSEVEGEFGRHAVKLPVARGAVDILFEPLARDAGDAWHCGGAASNEGAPGGIAQRLGDESPASGGDALDRIVERQAARLQAVRRIRAPSRRRPVVLQIVEAVKVHIKSALRDASGATTSSTVT